MAFDLDAWVAEAQGEPFTFTFGSVDYTLPTQPDIRAAALFDAGDYAGALRLMLGDERYQQFLASDGHLTRDGLLEVIRRWAAHAGASLGESSASTGSSKSTGRPSKRTSSTTTKLR